MARIVGWLPMFALIVFAQACWAEEARENIEKLALLEFFDGPPIVVQAWPTIPTEFRQRYRLSDDVATGLFLCNTDKPVVGCSTGMIVIPFSEIASIARDRNLAYVNLNSQPEHTAWVVMTKNGKRYRAEVPPIPPVLFTGDPAKVRFSDFLRAKSRGAVTYSDGTGATGELPVYAMNVDKGTTSYRTISPSFLKSLAFVSRTDAQGAVEKYAREERARIDERQRKEEQARVAREEQERAEEARRKAAETAAIKFERDAETRAVSFRRSMKPGDQSHCGMVIEVKKPIVQVQTMIGAVWLKISQMYQAGDHKCLFENGVYRD